MQTRLPIALALACGFAAAAAAQTPPSGIAPGGSAVRRPVVSPYLNLLRGGNPAVNYAGLVRPEQQLYNNQTQLQGQIGTVYSDVNQLQAVGPFTGLGGDLVTGKPFGFQTQGGYFLTAGRAGQGGFGGVGGFGTTRSLGSTARAPAAQGVQRRR